MKRKPTSLTPINSRRQFIEKSSWLVAGTALVTGISISCKENSEDQNEQKETEKSEKKNEEIVSANEDLMREHGLLQRMLLIYDRSLKNINSGEEFNPNYVNETATIVRDFVEDYHEKLEEDYLFPRLEKANRLNALTQTLRRQHEGGRKVTDQILMLTKNGNSPKGEDIEKLSQLMQAFNIMYRPHEAREDTILFPAFKKVISRHDYDALGEDFEKKEHEKFGKDGFDMMVDKIESIEKQIGIYDLDQFTPPV